MEKSSKRGKIPQSDWPLIMARYEAGETLSSIARTYDCSPPAISYVVSRSRARRPTAPSSGIPTVTATPAEPQLIKSNSGAPTATNDGARPPVLPEATLAESSAGNGHAVQPSTGVESSDRRPEEIWPETARHSPTNGGTVFAPARHPAPFPAPTPTHLHAEHGNGDHRPKLHLSLGNGAQAGNGAQSNGEAHPVPLPPAERPVQPVHQPYPAHRLDRTASHTEASHGGVPAASDHARAAQPAGIFGPSANGHSLPSARHDGNGVGKERTGAFIDRELRARVDADIAAFLAAFDAALADDTQENRSGLREATDRLLRAGARTRIELERLEARMPLPRRDPAERQAGWQHR